MHQINKITIKDVAREAGCGVATASRVLNNSGPASAQVREKVEKAAHDLGFSFSAIGRALQSNKSMTVGCIVPSLVNPVFAEAVQGVQSVLLGSGYQLLIASSNYEAKADEELIENLLSKGVDGLLATVASPSLSNALKLAKTRNIPISLMFHDPLDGFSTAYVDNFEAAREVARQFAHYQHRKTGFLTLRFSSSDRSRNRYAGFHAECKALGLNDPILIELSEADANMPQKLALVLEGYSDLTAIFASNDFLAIAIQKAMRLLNKRVPHDLSVIGFDGIEIGRLLEVPLATIETDPDKMGQQAAKTLLKKIQGEVGEQQPSLPFKFRTGATIAPPRANSHDDDQVAPRSPSIHLTKRLLNKG
ncbi:LacI family DNA-binding transcriptional regulator [Ahrensia kielensis]|uniref:LacI family DNA-binding transcriptional regulator n=1 Tax=Ahrensia kielensis TaxID=76980 RepID=A0ABU9T2T9_9HYPH